MANDTVLELLPDADGRWLIETTSGSRNLLDLDSDTYARRSLAGELGKGLDAGTTAHQLVEVEQWPKVNSTFRLWLDDGTGGDVSITSSFVTRIVRLADDQDVGVELPPQTVLHEVAQAPPINAWLLMGDEASFPDESELSAQRDSDGFGLSDWTCPRQIQRGDLVFLYFMSPRKAIHFAARALLPPVYDPSIEVNANRTVDKHQWWTDLSPFVQLPPIPFSVLRELHAGHLVLRGKPTHYLTPEVVHGLVETLDGLDDDQRLVMQTPVGDPDLPDPARTQLEDLRNIASGRLLTEKMVERHIVEPLLNLCFAESDDVRFKPQVKIPGAGVADYGLYSAGQLCGVIEVKLGVQRQRGGGLLGSPDLKQVLRYASATDLPAMLIDSNEFLLIDRACAEPSRSIERHRLTVGHLANILEHFEHPTEA